MYGQGSERLARLATARDELGDLLAALLPDLLEVLVTVLLRDRVAADLSDATVEPRAVELLDLLPALLPDLLVEVGSVTLRGGAATLLADLLVELWAVSLGCCGPAASSGFRDGHGSLVPRHATSPVLFLGKRALPRSGTDEAASPMPSLGCQYSGR